MTHYLWENSLLNRTLTPGVWEAVVAEHTDSSPLCRAIEQGYECSRRRGHQVHRVGRHIALGPKPMVVAAWPGEDLPTVADLDPPQEPEFMAHWDRERLTEYRAALVVVVLITVLLLPAAELVGAPGLVVLALLALALLGWSGLYLRFLQLRDRGDA